MQIPHSSRYRHLNSITLSSDTSAPPRTPAPRPPQIADRPAQEPDTFNPWPWVAVAALAVSILWLASK